MLSVAYRLRKEVTATLCQIAAQKDTQVANVNIYEHIFLSLLIDYAEIHVVHILKVLKENKNNSHYISTLYCITTGIKQTLQSNQYL